MSDVLRYALDRLETRSSLLDRWKLRPQSYYLLTLHRAENTDFPYRLSEVLDFVKSVSEGHPIIFPVHPRTKKILAELKLSLAENITAVEPLGYFDMVQLLNNCSLVLTDSGGLQKEAYWLQVPCITLREETEWLETVDSGWNVLYKNYKGHQQPVIQEGKAYGDGQAAARLVNIISNL
jgi:UDP-GlcNAc3NAcA epimerase